MKPLEKCNPVVHYDLETDMLYIGFRRSSKLEPCYTIETNDLVLIDVDAKTKEVVGVEVIGLLNHLGFEVKKK